LVVRWTRKRIYTDYDGYRTCQPYEVVARDYRSVVVRLADGELTHIRFEDDFYWLAIGPVCEYFKRVK